VVVLDQVHIGSLAILLDGAGWNQGHALKCLHLQLSVDTQIGKKRVVWVDEECAKLYRSGCGVDLIVNRLQFTCGQLRLIGMVVRCDLFPARI
jgi:hypothetical protein